jgi:hypothetical protein
MLVRKIFLGENWIIQICVKLSDLKREKKTGGLGLTEE